MTSHTAPASIHKLVETFEQNLDSYRSTKNETELRREFLDKFFTALGWDVANEKAYDEAGKEVVHEFSVEVSGQQKKADYAFRVGRGDKFDFLVEAKKPSVKIESSQDAAFQIRRYGWSAKLPINILTDFEHFAVYDCRAKPSYSDKASTGRILLIHYKEYVERWDEIAAIFSPEAVRQGSFAKYAEGIKGKRGTADVDDAFLQEIERWRELLAKNIALRNEDIDIAGLNYAVQMTIDRIVFLRICEERGIEAENQLQDITLTPNPSPAGRGAGGEGIYRELCELFKRADTKYNSGLFHFKQEKEQASRADDLTLGLDIDDKVLKDIISNLYYPKSPYAFLYIPADILGQVYERFLGKVIRLTAGHQAKVEEKPEVRKAGGVYYTPTYIVDYIVKNTVGKLVSPLPEGEGRVRERSALTPNPSPSGRGGLTPKEVVKLKIVDPACGSGTFLLGAYQFLLDWHLNWYVNDDAEKWVKQKALTPAPLPAGEGVRRTGEGGYRLTTSKKKEILLNNIHGVDIDAQAVEVTKLSLLLKVLENASGQLGLGMERVLPDLGNNIKCGNSLIGFDYFEGQLLPDEEERARVNPFDWKSEFPQVFSTPSAFGTSPKSAGGKTLKSIDSADLGEAGRGFDAVIGNPPYIRVRVFKEFYPAEAEYLEAKYQCATHVWDIYLLFFEKAIELLNRGGRASFIIPIQTLHQPNCESLRSLLLSRTSIDTIADLSQLRVFQDAIVKNCIFVVENSPPDSKSKVKIYHPAQPQDLSEEPIRSWPQSSVAQNPSLSMKIDLLSPMQSLFEKLESKSWRLDELCYVTFGLRSSAKGVGQGGKERLISDNRNAPRAKPYLEGRDIKRFAIFPTGRFIRYLPSEMYSPRVPELFETKKIVSQSMLSKKRLIATLDTEKFYVEQSLVCIIPHGILTDAIDQETVPLEFIIGILNSRLESFYFGTKIIDHSLGGGLIHATPGSQSKLIIPKSSKTSVDKMVSLVEAMLALHKSLAAAQSPAEKERLERQIQVTDREIDGLVYALYGLSPEEIAIVEGKE